MIATLTTRLHASQYEPFGHFSEIQGDGYKSLDENAKVEFVIASGSNGKSQATQVCVL